MTIASPGTIPDSLHGAWVAHAPADEPRNAVAELSAEHEVLCTLLARCNRHDDPPERSRARVAEVAERLELHMRLEEDILHRALGQRRVLEAAVEVAKVEHRILRRLLADLGELDAGSPSFAATLEVLVKQVRHHVEDEAYQFFPRVRRMSIDLDVLGDQLRARRGELMQRRSRAPSRLHRAAMSVAASSASSEA